MKKKRKCIDILPLLCYIHDNIYIKQLASEKEWKIMVEVTRREKTEEEKDINEPQIPKSD